MAVSPQYDTLLDALLMQAALVDDFLPRDLLQAVVPAEERQNILLRAHLMSALREKSTVHGARWQLRPIARRKVLAESPVGDGLPDTEIATALKGDSIYSPDGLRQLVEDETEVERLALAVSTLEQAGPAAPGHESLLAISSKLDRLRRDKATDALLGDGFVGRQQEIAALLQALDHPQRGAPLRSLHIQGLPGVGKTFLLEELSRQCRSRPRVVLVRLDFDRSSLSNGAIDAVFDEISRQVGADMPTHAGELQALRLQNAERRTLLASQSASSVPFDLLHRLIDILAGQERQLVLLLDTLEVLHGHGATFVTRLLDDLDSLADKERMDITLISAGRGPIFTEKSSRIDHLILLETLDREVTQAILDSRNVPQAMHARIFELSEGNPLRTILVARALFEQDGDAALGADEIREVGNGYLYRAVLSRVPTRIRDIAAIGLILPELGIEELGGIVGPALGLELDADALPDLMEELENQRWMIRCSNRDTLIQRGEVRREMLELTYAVRPEDTRRLNEYAVDWFAERDPARAMYHRLQLSRDGGEMPVVPETLALQLTDALMEELPPPAQDAVLRARGQRSRVTDTETASGAPPAAARYSRVAQKAVSAVPDRTVLFRAIPDRPGARLTLVEAEGEAGTVDSGGLADLRNMLESGERREASYLVKQIMSQPFALEGEAARLAITHQWRTGHWSMARQMFQMLSDTARHEAINSDMGLSGLAVLEMWAEFEFDRLCGQVADQSLPQLVEQALERTQRSGLRGGALLLAAMTSLGFNKLSEDIGPFERYLPQTSLRGDREAAERSHALRSEFGLSFGLEHDPQSLSVPQHAQLMAPLNPYGDAIQALLEDLADGPLRKVHRDVIALRDHLDLLSAHLVPDIGGVVDAQERAGSFPREIVALMGALGMTAEFATAYSYYSPIPDLPTIARAAERWQQATLGTWQYGKARPEGWEEVALNLQHLNRLDRLRDSDDPAEVALRLLRVWDDPSREVALGAVRPLPKKLQRQLAALLALTSTEARQRHMAAADVPGALQAPLIVLAETPADFEFLFDPP